MHSKSEHSDRTFKFAFIVPLSLLFLFPFVWMVWGSLKSSYDINKFVAPLTFDNYVFLIEETMAARWFFNSVYVALTTTLLYCLISSMAGYAFAKIRFAGNKFIFLIMISTMMLPKYVLLVPLFRIIRDLGFFNTYSGLIFPELGWAFGVFLIRQFANSIPTELIEATRMDGASEFKIFRKIILPLIKPALAALAIFTFVRIWNDYMWQLVIIQSEEMKTMPLGVAGFAQIAGIPDFGLLMSGSAAASLPIIILFLIFQKFFTRGITLGSIKG